MSIHEDPSTWRLETDGGIKYKLLQGHPNGTFDQEAAEITEEYIIQSKDFEDFIEESFPPTVISGILWTYATRREYPGFGRLFTDTVAFGPLEDNKPCDPYDSDPTAPDGTYSDFLKLSINYKVSSDSRDDPSNNLDQQFLEISSSTAGDFVTMPVQHDDKWDSLAGDDIKDINVPANKLIPMTEWSVKWPRVPPSVYQILLARSRLLIGTVNLFTVPTLYNPPAETLLFVGFSHRELYSWREDGPQVEFTLNFLEKHIKFDGGAAVAFPGHNHFFRPGVGWQRLLINGEVVYPLLDLNPLFVV